MKIFVNQADLVAVNHVTPPKSLQRVQPQQQHPVQLHEQHLYQKLFQLKHQQYLQWKIQLQEDDNVKTQINPH